MDDQNDAPEKFSDDPEEQLRFENEILKLKLRAELGGQMEELQDMPPELENMFLKNVIAFEQQHANGTTISVYEMIGKPAFEKETALDDASVSAALQNLTERMEEKHIVVDFAAEYTDREKYRFITEELFEHETMEIEIPEMVIHFSYEDFHPNHTISITERANEFITDWLGQKLNDQSWELADQLLAADGRIFAKAEITEKIKHIFEAYTSFENGEYSIDDVSFQLSPQGGIGHAEGMIRYDAILETGETLPVEGPFKLYMQLEEEWWQIFFFHWPGFEW